MNWKSRADSGQASPAIEPDSSGVMIPYLQSRATEVWMNRVELPGFVVEESQASFCTSQTLAVNVSSGQNALWLALLGFLRILLQIMELY